MQYITHNTNSINGISTLINNTNAIIQYKPTITNNMYEIQLPIEVIRNSLTPMINEAKNYLYAKGFSSQDVENMVITEGGTQEDLVLFVMSLVQIENNQSMARNYTSFFINTANARLQANDYLRCAAVAVGADVLWSLGSSSASAWTIVAMKKAFGAVAKRMLGPIGVAIAVVSFGVCIATVE